MSSNKLTPADRGTLVGVSLVASADSGPAREVFPEGLTDEEARKRFAGMGQKMVGTINPHADKPRKELSRDEERALLEKRGYTNIRFL